jgi:hypothetical protein
MNVKLGISPYENTVWGLDLRLLCLLPASFWFFLFGLHFDPEEEGDIPSRRRTAWHITEVRTLENWALKKIYERKREEVSGG